MAVSNFNLRGIPTEVMILLKREAKRLNTSVNGLVLKMIERGLGFTREKPVHHDLDRLAGSWSSTEEKIFKDHTQSFEHIDKELWK
ncbi:MAG: hypothetical protein HW387_1574 [Parachlamydiales bacterium]|nr:hypothetical protein [Parachlamydiales bacterium]